MGKREFMIQFKGWILSFLLRLQRLTWRIRIEGIERLDRLYTDNRQFLFCFWHGIYIAIFPILEGYRASVITNRSKRGNIIAEISKNFGYQSIQIPDKPHHGALSLLEEALSRTKAVGIAVDGPLGPRHLVKNGVIRIASDIRFDLLPVSIYSQRKIVLKKRWDRMEIPLLFTKISLVFGKPIKVPPKLNPDQVQTWAVNLAEAMTRLDKKAEYMIRSDRKPNF